MDDLFQLENETMNGACPFIVVHQPELSDERLSDGAKILLFWLRLRSQFPDGGNALVSWKTISQDMGIDESTVKRRAKKLRELGWIKSVNRGFSKTKRQLIRHPSSMYREVGDDENQSHADEWHKEPTPDPSSHEDYNPGRCSVYFIAAGGMIKIGISKDPERRIAELGRSSPLPLSILAIIPGGRNREKSLHERFAEHRKHGEWFTECQDILDYIKGVIS